MLRNRSLGVLWLAISIVLLTILLVTSTLAVSYAESSRMYQRKGMSREQEER